MGRCIVAPHGIRQRVRSSDRPHLTPPSSDDRRPGDSSLLLDKTRALSVASVASYKEVRLSGGSYGPGQTRLKTLPVLQGWALSNQKGKLSHAYNCFLNGEKLKARAVGRPAVDAAVRDGDEVVILMPISGG